MAATALAPICFTKPQALDLCVYRGDSGRLRVSIVDDAGAPLDVSGATWDCDIRPEPDGEIITTMTVTPIDASTVEVALSAAQSALLPVTGGVWDLEMTLNGDVTTLLAGKVTVTKDVSRADA